MYKTKLSLYYTIIALAVIAAVVGTLSFSFYSLDYVWEYSFLKEFLWDEENQRPGLILQGLWGTIYLSLSSIIFGTILGLLVGLILLSQEPVSRRFAVFYVDVFRNTPVLVLLYVVYYVVGAAFNLEPEVAGVLTLSLFCSSYVAEIFRGTIQEFDKGQIDAAKSMGLSPYQVSRYVVAPQALRKMLPPLVGQFVSLVKDSCLVSVISVSDLTKSALSVVSVSFRSLETWFVIALIYFSLNYILSTYGRHLEKRLRVS